MFPKLMPGNETENKLVADALNYARSGLLVFPLHAVKNGQCTCNKSDCKSPAKHPRTIHGLSQASSDLKIVKNLFGCFTYASANIAVRTGKESNLVVVDVDVAKGGRIEELYELVPKETLEKTLGVKTGGGFHLYFKYPLNDEISSSTSKLGKKIDVRGKGGYVVAPPSMHISGKKYEFLNDNDVMPFPMAFIEKLNQVESKAGNNKENGKTIDAETYPDGERNDSLARIAGKLRHAGLSQSELETSLLKINSERCQPPLEAKEVSEIARSIARYDVGQVAVKIGCTFGELQKLVLPRREEIIKGLARCENGLFNAVTNAGKTTIIRNLALCLVCGTPFLPLTTGGKCYRVAIVDSEDTLTFLRFDIEKMTADFSDADKKKVRENLFLICELSFGDEDLKLNRKEHFQKIVESINNFQADVVFIDTISSSFAIRNENDNSEAKEFVMKPLKRLSILTNSVVFAAHHIGKAKLEDGATKEGAHKGRGASAFSDLSRIVFNLEKNGENDSIILSCAKIKGEKFTDSILSYDKASRWYSKKGESKIQTNYDILLEVFADGKTYKRSEINEILDGEMSKPTITRQLSDAVRRGDLTKQKGFYTKNAQMLTPYSDEHLSISSKAS